MLKYMLDTNICIFTIKNKPASVREACNLHHGQLRISAITLMELVYGAEKSLSPKETLPLLRVGRRVLKCSLTTATRRLIPA
ncbi:hypothetical protein CFBP4215_00901 [Pseudomonas syringae pv. syringae]|nr:hypothetical protein CFBP4215_00901 [Pseudomonas syringae pv. syringae]